MKNIHVLPTDKPSNITIRTKTNELMYSYKLFSSKNGKDINVNQNIYITSDEEIKANEWFYSPNTNSPQVYGHNDIPKDRGFKKIILTTDQDLIKDGVQAIDDEFLEWFVKNPSCEFVEVKNGVKRLNSDGEEIGFPDMSSYKIIIPKEEPKQETLEETAERIGNNFEDSTFKAGVIYGVIEGAKWQQERMYSEMDIVLILSKFRDMKMIAFSEWFEQFKNK